MTLIDDVENGALLGIEGGELKELSVMYLADIDVVIEIEGTRIGWIDLRKLETGFGKDERLRTDGNTKSV